MASNEDIKAFIADWKRETGESIIKEVAEILMDEQAEARYQADQGGGGMARWYIDNGQIVQPEPTIERPPRAEGESDAQCPEYCGHGGPCAEEADAISAAERAAEQAASNWFAFPGDRPGVYVDDEERYR